MRSIGQIVDEFLNIQTEGNSDNPCNRRKIYFRYKPTDYMFLRVESQMKDIVKIVLHKSDRKCIGY